MISYFKMCCRVACLVAAGWLVQPCFAADAQTEIEVVNTTFVAAAQKGDSAALAALYSETAQLMPAGSEPIQGREGIQKFWQGALGSGIAAVSLKTLEVYAQGAAATEVGHYELRDRTGKVLDQGKYIVIWHRENTHWRLLRDMFSTNLPPAKT